MFLGMLQYSPGNLYVKSIGHRTASFVVEILPVIVGNNTAEELLPAVLYNETEFLPLIAAFLPSAN